MYRVNGIGLPILKEPFIELICEKEGGTNTPSFCFAFINRMRWYRCTCVGYVYHLGLFDHVIGRKHCFLLFLWYTLIRLRKTQAVTCVFYFA
ncbi:hypothetical protein D0U04_19295 [Bacillus clarus]|uniref:Uncharacterized protein n=1 Tax=Bacillus clarus TaxID=2338372 RepID=A0ABX9KS74_9BACI|nr:hypothetical protein D0U04_19295 [Bacillus clarus]